MKEGLTNVLSKASDAQEKTKQNPASNGLDVANGISTISESADKVFDKIDDIVDDISEEKGYYKRENPENIDHEKLQKNGRRLNEKGKIVDENGRTATQRAQNVGATVVGGYFGGAKGAEMANALSKSRAGQSVANIAEKAPLMKQSNEILDNVGALDAAEGAVETVLAAKKMDIKGVKENAKKTIKGSKKLTKKIILVIIAVISAFMMVFFAITAPIVAGYMILADFFDWGGSGNNYVEPSNPNESNPGSTGTGSGEYNDKYDGYVPEISTDEKDSLSIISKSEKLRYLFPNGIPTTPEEMAKYLTTITVNIINEAGVHTTKTLTVHKKLAANFKGAFDDLYKAGFKIKANKTGAYNWRTINGSSSLSHHSYGAAIDINWDDNPVCNTKSVPCNAYNPGANEYSITRSVANILEKHGLKWGLWEGSKYPNGVKYDYMHFSYTGG